MKNLISKAIALMLCIAVSIGVFHTAVQADGNTAGAASFVAGDINNDNKVNGKDLIRLLKFLSKWDVEVNENAKDVNNDGSVDNKDLIRLLKFISGWDVEMFVKLSFPIEKIEKLEGNIATKDNTYKVFKKYFGAVIDLADIPFGTVTTVTLTRSEECSELGYAFLKELPVLDTVPSYAEGYTKVIWDARSTVTLDIPEDAKYMYVYHTDNGVNYLPEKVEFSGKDYNKAPEDPQDPQEPEDTDSFTIATWNIGHFSNGQHKNSDFSDSDYAKKSAEFKKYIDESVGADIITLSEYSKFFTPSNPASSLFSSYTGASFEGEQRRYSCNAVYSKFNLTNFEVHEFECNKNAVITYTTAVRAPDYYYITADIKLGGETVTIVALHLAYDDKLYDTPPYIDTVCQNQMRELIEKFKNVPRVIMLGDFNAYSPNYFNLFSDAGYTVCNDGSVLTCTGSKTGGLEWAVDNIIVKGVSVSGFRSVSTGLSDHVAVIASISPLAE